MKRVVKLPRGGIRIDVRTATATFALAALAVAVGLLALSTGDFTVALPDVIRALGGGGSRKAHIVVVEWRLPRVLLGVLVGAALGAAGAIFQVLTRNPLGSPDVLGFSTGAYTGVLVAITVVGADFWTNALGALIGGIATAVVVYLLATRRGFDGLRLIIAGIAIAALLDSVNQWFIIETDLHTAISAAFWQQGDLNGVGWAQVAPATICVLILTIPLLGLGTNLSMLNLGADTARSLGVDAARAQTAYLVCGIGLTAVATAVAGPITFVALVAPQLVKRLARTAELPLLPSAVMGALLVVACDWLGQRLFAPTMLPVGLVTVSCGGAYFLWLLVREGKRQ